LQKVFLTPVISPTQLTKPIAIKIHWCPSQHLAMT
jgi:hypothetical protein